MSSAVGGTSDASPRSISDLRSGARITRPSGQSAFTMVEIAICLAIIGIALVAIIGVLPLGINVQKDNREETLIDQDATVFIENIRNGARGLDDLTNYVFAITNSWTSYDNTGKPNGGGVNGYSYANFSVAPLYPTATVPSAGSPITNGMNIIGLLSTPEYINASSGAPIPSLVDGGISSISNHVVAYVRSLSGPATEKPPQDNPIILGDTFSYKMICNNVPVAVDTNSVLGVSAYNRQLTVNLHELRLTFLWPLLPNGNTGNGRHTFATTVAGQIVQTDVNGSGQLLYFFQPQSFTNAP